MTESKPPLSAPDKLFVDGRAFQFKISACTARLQKEKEEDIPYVLEARLKEAEGVLGLKQDEYVQQVGTWKIIQRLEEEIARYKELSQTPTARIRELENIENWLREENAALLAEVREMRNVIEFAVEALEFHGKPSMQLNSCLDNLESQLRRFPPREGGQGKEYIPGHHPRCNYEHCDRIRCWESYK